MHNNNEFDVAVVGYGPVGQMLAILLGEMGYRVAAFERWPEIYPLPRAVHYDDEIARVFQLAGISDEVREITERVPDFYEWHNKDGEVLLRIDWSAQGSPAGRWRTSSHNRFSRRCWTRRRSPCRPSR
jgi:2-polyprenyl-6-methoxyphenol hydroxylase-like FAD-dependent oxidoreductase